MWLSRYRVTFGYVVLSLVNVGLPGSWCFFRYVEDLRTIIRSDCIKGFKPRFFDPWSLWISFIGGRKT